MIRALILDFDGLILDTESPMQSSWMEIYRAEGLHVSDEDWAVMLGSSPDPPEAYDLLEAHLGHPVDRDAIHKRRLRRELELLANEDPMPGVLRLLHQAEEASLSLAVASSSDRKWVVDHLRSHGLLGRFSTIVCADDVRETKPAPDLYVEAIARLGVRPTEAIAFEDSRHGVASAKAAGLFCVAVPNRITRCLDFDRADLVVSSLADRDLHEYLEAAGGPGRAN